MTIKIDTGNGTREISDFRDLTDTDRNQLKAAGANYNDIDAGRVIKQLDDWAMEFDEFPPAGAYQSWQEAFDAAALAKHINPLPPNGRLPLTDPDTPQGQAITTTVGSKQWWDENLAQVKKNHPLQEVVIGGHGYRKPWETDTFLVPSGTTLVFHVLDDTGFGATLAFALASYGSKDQGVAKNDETEDARGAEFNVKSELGLDQRNLRFQRVYGPGEKVLNYTVTPEKPGDVNLNSCVYADSRVKLSTLLRENLGTVHSATCRLIDWWGSFSEMPGRHIHQMPQGWVFAKTKDHEGYIGPNGEQPGRPEPKF